MSTSKSFLVKVTYILADTRSTFLLILVMDVNLSSLKLDIWNG